MISSLGAHKQELSSGSWVSSGYVLQWQQSYGSNPGFGARYEGPQPIGDADNDGKNELIIGGRDQRLRIMKWNDAVGTYDEVETIFCPFYPFYQMDPGGFAIGDVTNDGTNEIAATWGTAVYRYILGNYRFLGWNPWIFRHGGGSADCIIGDITNDGKNELIVTGGGFHGQVPEVVVFRWIGFRLFKIAVWDDPGVDGYVYMPGLGDIDGDGENELAVASANKLVVLDWNKATKQFDATIVKQYMGQNGGPFGCVCKDADSDGNNEILLSFYAPRISIFKWNGTAYHQQFDLQWPGGEPVIEGIDIGDTDSDGFNEVCAGAGVTHILQWNGETYVEEAVLPTWGWIAVLNIGDCDNDGNNEISIGNVAIDAGQEFMQWVYKFSSG
ncbi:MAG: VCBS repeat-containing protein [Candidatus Thermoplasmatota archaeon]